MNERRDILRRTLNLALAIYRLTDRFPKGEVLIGQLKKIANEITGDLASGDYQQGQTEKKIDVLFVYFKIALSQNWVKAINWLILEREYHRLREVIGLLRLSEKGERLTPEKIKSHNFRKKPAKEIPFLTELTERQQKILAEIRQRKSLRMTDLVQLFQKQASERTIRNDLQILLQQTFIGKRGAKKSTEYFIK